MLVRSTGEERCLRKLKFSLHPHLSYLSVSRGVGHHRTKEAWDGVIWEGQNGHHLSIFHHHRKTFNTLLSGNPGCSLSLLAQNTVGWSHRFSFPDVFLCVTGTSLAQSSCLSLTPPQDWGDVNWWVCLNNSVPFSPFPFTKTTYLQKAWV